MWSPIFLIEVAVKYGVSLGVPRNEARQKPHKPDMCFRCRKHSLKKKSTVICTIQLHAPFIRLDLHLQPSIALTKNSKNEHLLQGFLPRGTSFVTLGLKKPK